LRIIKAQAVVAADCVYSLKFLRLWLQSHCYFATRFLLSGFIQKAIVPFSDACPRILDFRVMKRLGAGLAFCRLTSNGKTQDLSPFVGLHWFYALAIRVKFSQIICFDLGFDQLQASA
jgi:hypothetical protein